MRGRTIAATAVMAVLLIAPAARAADGETRLDRARARLVEARAALDLVTSQRDVALGQREEAREAVAQARRDATDWRRTTYLLAALVLATAGWLLGRRRHTVRVRIPDSPAGLEFLPDDRADRSRP
ncbi:MAG TPA: hypothetical protein VF235_09240 [Actinomycetota bacterium]